MKGTGLKVERREHVCTLSICRPETLNALDTVLLEELRDVFRQLEKDPEVYVVILTGCERSFVAGADIAEMSGLDAGGGKAFGELGTAVFREIELSSKIVLAAINGYALGGGCELAMACDLRIASSKAKFAQPETGLGIIPGFAGTQRLARLIGIGRAKELIYTGEVIDAAEAYRIGLVNRVTDPEDLLEVCNEIADKIVSKAPVALRYAKEAITWGMETNLEGGIKLENNLFGLCFATADQKRGMQAFLNKEKTEFTNE